MSQQLFGSLATTPALAAVFSDAGLLTGLLRFEAALARAEAAAGLIPSTAADAVARAGGPAAFDAAAIARDARASGTIAIPFVSALRARVRAIDPAAASFVHHGATSQDAVDTALVLCLVEARRLLAADHGRLAAALRRLSDHHAESVMLARTLMQPATPTTFGLKAAGWSAAASRCHARVEAAFDDACVLQFGGASGTLAALGEAGVPVATQLARELELPCPDAPWHAHRDRVGALVAACGVMTGTLGKMARDVSLLMQYEVAEASEPGGRSSTMPHKRNPAGCAVALAAATRVPGLVSSFLGGMVQEHERGLGGWHAEITIVADVVQATGAALAAMADVAETLRVDSGRMRANLAATRGIVYAERASMLLEAALGRESADRLVAAALDAARRDGADFVDAITASSDVPPALSTALRTSLDSPASYLGSAEHFRRRLIGAGGD